MKRMMVVAVATAALVGGMLAAPTAAQGPPPHPHMLVLGLELDGEEPVGMRRCVDLAGGRKVPLNAHHANLHVGGAGEMLFTKAGHAVVPGAPITPFANCAALIDAFGF